jgi:hypothetical protein
MFQFSSTWITEMTKHAAKQMDKKLASLKYKNEHILDVQVCVYVLPLADRQRVV